MCDYRETENRSIFIGNSLFFALTDKESAYFSQKQQLHRDIKTVFHRPNKRISYKERGHIANDVTPCRHNLVPKHKITCFLLCLSDQLLYEILLTVLDNKTLVVLSNTLTGDVVDSIVLLLVNLNVGNTCDSLVSDSYVQ